jgi:hypothetical protein
MKKIVIISISLLVLSGCVNRTEEKATKTGLADIKEMAESSLKYNVPAEQTMPVIYNTAKKLYDKLDPEGEFPATKKAGEIYQGYLISKQYNVPNPALEEIKAATQKNIDDIASWSWGAILGGGLLALGAVGKFLGGPWNLAGLGLQAIGQRMIPDYEKVKKAAVGAIASVDKALSDYGDILDTCPDTKKALKEKLGQDPVEWMKDKLNSVQTDLGTPEVSHLLNEMKKQMTTEDGVLKPTTTELDKFISKSIS